MPPRPVHLLGHRFNGIRIAAGVPLIACAIAMPHLARAQQVEPQKSAVAPEPYVDRLIDGGELKPIIDIDIDTEDESSTSGNIRSLIIEIGGSRISPKSRTTDVDTAGVDNLQQEAGVTVSGRYQTNDFGLLGVDAQLRRGSRDKVFSNGSSNQTNATITLSSADLPLGNGWIADSALGMTVSKSIGLINQQGRFFIPTSPLLGTSVTLNKYARISAQSGSEDPKPVASVNISVGEPGLLGGLRLGDFTALSGIGVSVGGQADLSRSLTAGFQAVDVENTRDPYSVVLQPSGPSGDNAKISSRAVLASLGYRSQGLRLQANAIWSQLDEATGAPTSLRSPGEAVGGWIDASYRSGRTVQTGGAYYFGPNLSWGNSAVVNNAFGAYYRISKSSQRWRFTFSADAVDTVNGAGSSGFVVNSDVRRQLTFGTSIGVNSTFRNANGETSVQTLVFVDFSTALGSTRAEAGWSHDPFSDLFRVGWSQNWSLPSWLPSGSRLSTQLSFDHRNQNDALLYGASAGTTGRSNNFSAAISGGASPFNGISFDASLAYSSNAARTSSAIYGPVDSTGGILSTLSSQQGQSFSATLVATARLSSAWTLSASFTDSRSSLSSRYGLLGLPPSPLGYTPGELEKLQNSSFRLRAGYLTLRYSLSAGRAKRVAGRREYPGGGSGNLEGHVYLDGNGNGIRDANESGVAAIIVILDGIQAVSTDQTGLYRFDNVADGPHRITVNADALPLPWSLRSNEASSANGSFGRMVNVEVRSTAVLDIGAVRQ
jgi:SdrD B-like domain